jgi:hypothetical protein
VGNYVGGSRSRGAFAQVMIAQSTQALSVTKMPLSRRARCVSSFETAALLPKESRPKAAKTQSQGEMRHHFTRAVAAESLH